ncbi:hypothetical protein PV04_05369 [Phialophora macrospora]|uniref:Alpha/beta hydrolase fold-3 domain-containing protein n=1 Tax=Phialophora macrospora TaxID=1851006 RepID=A0A0D2CWH6_9EURO|nr:hypothetical protein PV04_05369 [Phialophora macrospora]
MSDQGFLAYADVLRGLDFDKFSPNFDVLESSYPSANGKDQIRLHILVPKSISHGQRQRMVPLMVRIHGGYLVTGSSLYAPYFGRWTLQYAIQAGAIIVSPNYRLLPESNGTEILADMDAFWHWLRGGEVDSILTKSGFESLRVDLEQTLVMGESSGGYLAMHLMLTYPNDIQAVVAVYPVLDLKSDFFTKAYSKPIAGLPNRPVHVLENHLNKIRSIPRHQLQPVPEADPPDRLELSFAMVQHGRYLEFLGQDNRRLFPMERITDEIDADAAHAGAKLPFMFIFHGKDDRFVPCQGTVHFIETLAKTRPRARYHLELQPGDHGFDAPASIETTTWLRDGLNLTSSAWLKGKTGCSL